MNKKTKLALGLGVVAVAAYYLWKKQQDAKAKTTAFANQTGKTLKFGRPANLPSGLNTLGENLMRGAR